MRTQIKTWSSVAVIILTTTLCRADKEAESFEAKRAKDAEIIAPYIALGAKGEKLPPSFSVGLDWGPGRKFPDIRQLCQVLLDADFVGMVLAPRDMAKATPTDAPCHEVFVHVEGRGVYAAECFCEVPFADEAVTQRFRQLHEKLTKLALPVTDEEKKQKASVDALRRDLASGAAGQQLPESFQVRIFTHGIGRSVGLSEDWIFTPTTVERVILVRDGKTWKRETVEKVPFTRMKDLCAALWQGEFLRLAQFGQVTGGGAGPFLDGTWFIGGERSIAVSTKDYKLAIEKNCVRAAMETNKADLRKFADLYDRIKGFAPSPVKAIHDAIAKGARGEALPEDFAVVIETFGSKADAKNQRGWDQIVSEAWRFTPTKVETYRANSVEKSRNIADLKEVCQALQKEGFIEMATVARGERFDGILEFDGVPCTYGWRYVRVTADGRDLYVGEGTIWPVFADEKSAQAMRGLYTALREMATR